MNDRVAGTEHVGDGAQGVRDVEGPRFSYAVGVMDRIIRRSLVVALQPFELTVAEYTALSLISRRDGYSNAELARRSLVSPQAMHEMISSLERRELLERAPSESHRSIRHTHLTERSRELLERCNVAVDEMEEVMLAGVSSAKRTEMIEILRQAIRNLRDFPERD
ncbi:MAG: MarR family transcriptional regulator [Acidimicrobiia bacterium]